MFDVSGAGNVLEQDVQKLDKGHRQIVVERHDELRRFDEWFNHRNPATVVCSVSGIGGIGKTTFLGQIAERALGLGIKTIRVDGDLVIANPSQLLLYLCDQAGLNLPAGTECISDMITQLSGWLSEHRAIFLFDHFEAMVSIESFIRTQWIPGLPVNGVMLVFASRAGLSIGWRTDPTLITRITLITLNNLSWQQSLEYAKRAGIARVDWQQRISRETSGYPLALALAVQSALNEIEHEEDHGYSIHEISAGLIREVAPHLNLLLDGLIFLRISTQDVLSHLLQRAVPLADYRDLGRLSFVRVTSKGLAIHDVARAYLLSDLKMRDPQRFDQMFQRAVRILGRMIEAAPRGAAYEATHNLITLCMYARPVFAFPTVPVPMQISARTLPQCKPVVESDVGELHRLMDTGIVGGMAMPEPQGQHELLDLLIRHFPESLRIIRCSDGRPTAFTTLVPLSKEVITLLPTSTVEALQERLGSELSKYERVSAVETDTLISPITTVPLDPQEFTFFDLLLAIKLTGWLELAQGKRCLLFSSIPEVKAFHAQLGYAYLQPQGIRPQPVDVYALDFRTRSMGQWLVSLLLDTKTAPLRQAIPSEDISIDILRSALTNLRHPMLFKPLELARALELSGDELYRILHSALTDTVPPKPLTSMLQNILRLSYVEGMSVVAIADALKIGRTTYYRYLEKALNALKKVIVMESNAGP